MAAAKPYHFDKHGALGILAIDDDQVNLMVMESLLRPLGFVVTSAQDGSEAYGAVNGEDTWPDIVFLDYNLEFGDSGETVLAKLRQMFGTVAVPIVMCTAMSAGSTALDKCLQLGATGVMLKPYERSKVLEVINSYCGSKGVPSPNKPAAAAAAPLPQPAPSTAASAPEPLPTAPLTIEQFCTDLGLEYVGKKLQEAGISVEALSAMDDTSLRKAGVVVKGQRDKLLEAARALV